MGSMSMLGPNPLSPEWVLTSRPGLIYAHVSNVNSSSKFILPLGIHLGLAAKSSIEFHHSQVLSAAIHCSDTRFHILSHGTSFLISSLCFAFPSPAGHIIFPICRISMTDDCFPFSIPSLRVQVI